MKSSRVPNAVRSDLLLTAFFCIIFQSHNTIIEYNHLYQTLLPAIRLLRKTIEAEPLKA